MIPTVAVVRIGPVWAAAVRGTVADTVKFFTVIGGVITIALATYVEHVNAMYHFPFAPKLRAPQGMALPRFVQRSDDAPDVVVAVAIRPIWGFALINPQPLHFMDASAS
jgi:hypothetical protein